MTGDLQFLHTSFNAHSSQKKISDADVVKAYCPSAEDIFCGIVGRSKQMQQLFKDIQNVTGRTHVLIRGPVGAGKGLVARAIQTLSSQNAKELCVFNYKSELFGHGETLFLEKIELCQKGSFLLEEVEKMPRRLQGKLLQCLKNKNDIRLIATTSKNLQQFQENNEFFQDLLKRLSATVINIPSLSERREDISLLLFHFFFLYGKNNRVPEIETDALDLLMDYSWPGNVEELENLAERLVVLKEKGRVEISDLPPMIVKNLRQKMKVSGISIPLPKEGIDLKKTLYSIENSLIDQAMSRVEGNKNKASKLLGLNRTTLIEKLKKRGLQS